MQTEVSATGKPKRRRNCRGVKKIVAHPKRNSKSPVIAGYTRPFVYIRSHLCNNDIQFSSLQVSSKYTQARWC